MGQNLDAIEAYNAVKSELFDELEAIKKSAENKMDDTIRTIESRYGEFGYILMKSQALKASMLQHFTHLEVAANTLLRYYRDENARHRTTPTPRRFHSEWMYVRPSFNGEIVADTSRKAIEEALEKALEEIPRHRNSLHNSYRSAMRKYQEIDALLGGGGAHT